MPPSGGMFIQNVARNPVLVNNRSPALRYRAQTLASNLAKSPNIEGYDHRQEGFPREQGAVENGLRTGEGEYVSRLQGSALHRNGGSARHKQDGHNCMSS